jgi:hypothetical protein
MVRAARVERVVLVEPQAILAILEMPEVVEVAAADQAARQAPQSEAQPQDLTGLVIPTPQRPGQVAAPETTPAQVRAVVEACFTRSPQALVIQVAPGTQAVQVIPATQATPGAPVIQAAVGQMEATALPVLPGVEQVMVAQVAQAAQEGRATPVTRELLRSRVTTLPMCCPVAPTPSRLDRAHRPVRL